MPLALAADRRGRYASKFQPKEPEERTGILVSATGRLSLARNTSAGESISGGCVRSSLLRRQLVP